MSESQSIIEQAYRHVWAQEQAFRPPPRQWIIRPVDLRRLLKEEQVLHSIRWTGDQNLIFLGIPVLVTEDVEPLTRADLPVEWKGYRHGPPQTPDPR